MEEIKKIISDFINKVKENPGTLFGILYPYVLTIIVIIGLYYVANVGNIAVNKTSAFVPDTTVINDLPVVPARTVPPVDIFKMKNPSDELIQKGKELYTTNCASCHNETGAGGGPASVGLNPAPRNFTNPDGWKNGRTLSAIYTTLEEGIEGSSMISYNFLTPQERISIAHYIRKEFMQNPPADSDDDLAALNSLYNLAGGMEVPAQIPVATAMEIIAAENNDKTNKFVAASNLINNEKSSNAVVVFNHVINNKQLALSSLINSSSWRSGEKAFSDFIASNIGQNGFSSRVTEVSDSDLTLLYNYLIRIL
jgi:mono/diheme cytochrome c family protein